MFARPIVKICWCKPSLLLASCAFFAIGANAREHVEAIHEPSTAEADLLIVAANKPNAAAEKSAPTPPAPAKPMPAPRPKSVSSILDLQDHLDTQSLEFADGVPTLKGSSDQGSDGVTKSSESQNGRLSLVSLNNHVNAWYLLRIRWPDSQKEYVFNIENPDPRHQRLMVDPKVPQGILVVGRNKSKFVCEIWTKKGKEAFKASMLATSAYTPVCGGRLYVRHQVDGRKTTKEWVTEFLRDNVWGGEQITTFVKERFFKDTFLIKSQEAESADAGAEAADKIEERAPRKAEIDKKFEKQLLDPVALGISVDFEAGRRMGVGRWYESKHTPGTFVSVIAPNRISPVVLDQHKTLVAKLDNIESDAMAYLVAFDLSQFELAFSMGTDHPAVGWSPRVLPSAHDKSKQGPDGIDNWNPLVTTGMINPELAKRVVATFTGGFKRDHGAFKWGRLATVNHGSHYGLIDNGVVFSSLNPGLATLYVMNDGRVGMKTWREGDSEFLGGIRYARQNGVAIIEYEETTNQSVPGGLVKSWGGGNWSGSEDSRFRTLRAGACLQPMGDRNYLIYGYFSSVTPSAMARVFQAYGCRYAMHLDMNALEHTYLALYQRHDKGVDIEHLITGMNVLDKEYQKKKIPRFVGFPDNRDFFYLMRKSTQEGE